MSLFENGLTFTCIQCSRCCRHDPGYVFLSKSDLQAIADYLSLTVEEVKSTFCTRVGFSQDFSMISLLEKDNHDCIFWEDGGCRVYQARPIQCRTYPFWSSVLAGPEGWEREKRQCPGIGQGRHYSCEEIEQLLELRKRNSPVME